MKLVLTKPSFWPVHWLDAGAAGNEDASILVGAMEVASGPPRSWIERASELERPAFTRAEILRASRIHSALRWPMEIAEARITAGAQVVERRLIYVYTMLQWCAPIVFRASPSTYEAELSKAETVLASARPEWSSGVVAISDLYK
jgi:hypothetical protein